LTNAIKFTDRGGCVTVSSTQTEDGGIAIGVRDTGIGMPAEAIARIGQPFMQADNRLARRYEGTGLGLAITKRLIELHQGALTVHSEMGRGTNVVLHLPAARTREHPRRALG
jgi:signal transduction histidine kinase